MSPRPKSGRLARGKLREIGHRALACHLHQNGICTAPAVSQQRFMQIWMSNSHSQLAYDRDLFAVVCQTLISRLGAKRVAQRFQLLAALAALPWLDQPRSLAPTRLIFEIHDAWEELWALRLREVVASPSTKLATRRVVVRSLLDNAADSDQLGRYLARPLHELTVFAAAASERKGVRVATHPRLIAEPGGHRAWRVIQGGLTQAAASKL